MSDAVKLDQTSKPEPAIKNGSPAAAPSVEVYAVYGVEPEVQAYAIAKYSRSALSMKESLREINRQKAEKFLNTFYFQYGHRSIADLAHIALAIERLSILAAIAVADEQRWDGQERSTRYQDFKKSGFHTPDFGTDEQARNLYCETIDGLFSVYEALSERMARYLGEITPKPADMKRDAATGAGIRHLQVSAALGYQHVIGPNCQCSDARDPGFTTALAYPSGSPHLGRLVEACRHFPGL